MDMEVRGPDHGVVMATGDRLTYSDSSGKATKQRTTQLYQTLEILTSLISSFFVFFLFILLFHSPV